MDEREFVANRQRTWERLSEIVARAQTRGLKALGREELRELGSLHRRASADLAYARTCAVSPLLVARINDLVGRSYSVLYQTDTRSWGGIRWFFTHEFPQTFRRRFRYFLAAAGFMLLGALIGWGLVMQSESNMELFLPPGSDLHKSVQIWKAGKVHDEIHDDESALFASELMQNNIQVSFIAFAFGALLGLPTVYVLVANGGILGGLTAIIHNVGQHHTYWPGILPHGVVELSVICFAGAAGLSLGWAILAPGAYRRRDALVLAARDAVKLVMGGVLLLVFAGLVEAFISHSLLPAAFKISFGIASGIALYAYLALSGREPAEAKAASSP